MASLTKDRVLMCAQKLWELRGFPRLDLDTVDSAFYWELCKSGLRSDFIDLAGRYLRDPSHEEGAGELKKSLEVPESLGPGLDMKDWLTGAVPPKIRAPLFSWQSFTPTNIPCFQEATRFQFPICITRTSGDWVFLGVRDSRWSGDEVERNLREQVQQLEDDRWSVATKDHSTGLMPEEAVVILDMKFYEAGTLQVRSVWAPAPEAPRIVSLDSPVIMVTTTYPLPPEGQIASAFNAVAIEQHGWNGRLFGAGARQNQGIEVAIRTWTIGLLKGLGLDSHAVGRLTEPLFRQPVSEQIFNEQRRELVRRVPEAEIFVYQRRRHLNQRG